MKFLSPTYLLPLFFIVSIARVGAGEMPNILLLMGDDHGWDEVAYNGHPHLKTPILDEMAEIGLNQNDKNTKESSKERRKKYQKGMTHHLPTNLK